MSDDRRYTEEEVFIRERIASIAARTDALEGWLRKHTTDETVDRARYEEKLEAILTAIQEGKSHTEKCREDIRDETKENYVSHEVFKMEMSVLETQMQSVMKRLDYFWLKVAAAAGGAGSLGAFVADMLFRTVGK